MTSALRLWICVALVVGAFVPFVMAGTGVTNGQWYEFSFTQVLVPAQGCFPADPAGLNCTPSSANNSVFAGPPPWTFTTGKAGGSITVTDAFLYGDSFEVFNNGVSIGNTPNLPAGGGCGSDPAVCVLDPKASHATFALGQGLNAITIEPAVIVNAGAGYFMVTGALPEPSTLVLFVPGLGMMIAAWRRLRR